MVSREAARGPAAHRVPPPNPSVRRVLPPHVSEPEDPECTDFEDQAQDLEQGKRSDTRLAPSRQDESLQALVPSRSRRVTSVPAAPRQRMITCDEVPVKEIALGDGPSKTTRIGGLLDGK
uniref:Uncharacterized protein n=1 Tax=Oryza sativa subsp. japonica TaxID=39947 RepID=Q67UY6_ORYSJ|nr:hypothetical protein [Oryza sativa Japonica Group]